MRFYTQIFDNAGEHYRRLAVVLQASASEHETEILVRSISDKDSDLVGHLHGTYYQNCRKTRHHAQLIHGHNDGELVALLDADMLVLREMQTSLPQAIHDDTDIAITVRQNVHSISYPINTGLVATRVSLATHDFHDAWANRAREMIHNPSLFKQFSRRFGGINQSALGSLLEESVWKHIKVQELPTAIWNAVSNDHAQAAERSRLVHILGKLRRLCLSERRLQETVTPAFASLVNIWKSYDRSANNVGQLR